MCHFAYCGPFLCEKALKLSRANLLSCRAEGHPYIHAVAEPLVLLMSLCGYSDIICSFHHQVQTALAPKAWKWSVPERSVRHRPHHLNLSLMSWHYLDFSQQSPHLAVCPGPVYLKAREVAWTSSGGPQERGWESGGLWSQERQISLCRR